MSFKNSIRVIFTGLFIALVLLPAMAFADRITSNDKFVEVFRNKGDETPCASVRISEQDSTYDEGWYYVYNGGGAYVRAYNVTVLNATTPPTTDETTPPPSLDATTSPPPVVVPTTPPLTGQADTQYTGTIISYTVPQGGLMLFDKINGKQVESIKAGTKINLTSPALNENGDEDYNWYSIYSNGKTYYVPANVVNNVDITATNPPLGSVTSVVISSDPSIDESYYHLFSKCTAVKQGTKITGYILENDSGRKLQPGTRINARYMSGTSSILTYTDGGITYYFYSQVVQDASQSTATVVGNDTTNLMSEIRVTIPAGGERYLYREKSDTSSSYVLQGGANGQSMTLYGVRIDDVWYKVMYGTEIFYMKINAGDDKVSQSAVNNTATTDTFWVTIGANGGRLFKERKLSTNVAKMLSAGQSVLVGPYDATWYVYTVIENGQAVVYYLYRPDLADQTAANKVGAFKVTLLSGTPLYDRITAVNPSITLPAGTYVVYEVNSNWYSLTYDNLTYYIKKESVQANTGSSSATAPSRTVAISAGSTLVLNASTETGANAQVDGPATIVVRQAPDGSRLPPAEYYETTYNGETYLVSKAAISQLEEDQGATGTTNASSSKLLTLYGNQPLVVQKNASGSSTEDFYGPATLSLRTITDVDIIRVSLTAGQTYYLTTLPGKSGEYLVSQTAINNIQSYASVTDITNDIERIAYVPDGKTFYVTIGLAGAQLYVDSDCTNPASTFLRAGEVVQAKKYTDRLYLVSGYYLSVKDIASIRGGDDATAGKTTVNDETIAEIAKGQIDTSFSSTIISYTIPSGGMWLYYDNPPTRPAMILDGGKKIQLNEVSYDVYTVWYGGSQYYVPGSSLNVTIDKTVLGGTYSILLARDVDLYTTYTANPKVSQQYLSGATSNTLRKGTRVNVSIQLYKAGTKSVLVYKYTDLVGKVYYFYGNAAFEGAGASNAVNNDNDTYAALVSSNTDTNLITIIPVTFVQGDTALSTKFYTSPSDRSAFNTFNVSSVYGVKYDNRWYKVMYDDRVYYIDTTTLGTTTFEQVVIANSVTSTNYTVVIGSGGAQLYTSPDAKDTNKWTLGGVDQKLPAGTSIMASKVNSMWYVCSINGLTRYFQNNAVSNVNTNAAVSSYIITIPSDLSLYNTLSDTALASSMKLPAGQTYTFRHINKDWSSVVYGGVTYYIKNADIDGNARKDSTPIGTTSIGNTYKITVGNVFGSGVTVYADSKLTTPRGTLSAGTQTTGVKMFVEYPAPVTAEQRAKELVFKITFNGSVGYINANVVTGVAQGDEVSEVLLAQQQQQQSDNAGSTATIGETVMKEMDVGTIIYQKMDLSAASLQFHFKQTVQLTKVDASWYSLNYNGEKWYFPASKVEVSGTVGTKVTVSVGETYTYSFLETTMLYATTQEGAPTAEVILAASNATYPIKRISDQWYEIVYQGKTYFIKASDINLPYVTNSQSTTTQQSNSIQHDGTGYITPMLLVSPTSGSVNMRKSASTTSTILARIPKGVQVKNNSYTVDASKNVWYNITYAGKTGYIIGDYVSPVGTVTVNNNTDVSPANDIGRTLVVDMSEVNVRSGPGSSYSIIGRVAKGTSIVPLDYKVDAENMVWYSFKYTSTVTAYIRADYLAGSATTSVVQSGNVAIKSGGTNLRSGPGDSFSVVSKLARDIIVTIIGTGTDAQNNTWYHVTIDGDSGYLRSDLVRPLTASEQSSLMQSVINSYAELRYGDKGSEVLALQQQLIKLGYLSIGDADGSYGTKTVNAVKAFQRAKGMTADGVASSGVQGAIYNTASVPSGSTKSLDWFSTGFSLINANPNITIYDTMVGVSWNAKYINGKNHADIVPASKADADKLKAYNITGSYIRRPVIVNIAGQAYAGSMYAFGHGETSYVSYFHGVMCIHFTGSKTHGTDNVDKDHQAAIQEALNYSTQ